MNAPRSGCPINLTLEALVDRWSLWVCCVCRFATVSVGGHIFVAPATRLSS